MDQVRIHGRGGQGSVTLAHLIGATAFEEGQWAQSFPAFGVERRGAPVEAFVRIDAERITDRSQVREPDYVIVQDPSLLEFVDVTAGVKAKGLVLLNSVAAPETLGIEVYGTTSTVTINATRIASNVLGRPLVNTALLGALAGASDRFGLNSVESAIVSAFPGEIGEQNVRAAREAFAEVTVG